MDKNTDELLKVLESVWKISMMLKGDRLGIKCLLVHQRMFSNELHKPLIRDDGPREQNMGPVFGTNRNLLKSNQPVTIH